MFNNHKSIFSILFCFVLLSSACSVLGEKINSIDNDINLLNKELKTIEHNLKRYKEGKTIKTIFDKIKDNYIKSKYINNNCTFYKYSDIKIYLYRKNDINHKIEAFDNNNVLKYIIHYNDGIFDKKLEYLDNKVIKMIIKNNNNNFATIIDYDKTGIEKNILNEEVEFKENITRKNEIINLKNHLEKQRIEFSRDLEKVKDKYYNKTFYILEKTLYILAFVGVPTYCIYKIYNYGILENALKTIKDQINTFKDNFKDISNFAEDFNKTIKTITDESMNKMTQITTESFTKIQELIQSLKDLMEAMIKVITGGGGGGP